MTKLLMFVEREWLIGVELLDFGNFVSQVADVKIIAEGLDDLQSLVELGIRLYLHESSDRVRVTYTIRKLLESWKSSRSVTFNSKIIELS